jgi:hypothetical protein
VTGSGAAAAFSAGFLPHPATRIEAASSAAASLKVSLCMDKKSKCKQFSEL